MFDWNISLILKNRWKEKTAICLLLNTLHTHAAEAKAHAGSGGHSFATGRPELYLVTAWTDAAAEFWKLLFTFEFPTTH